MQIKISLKWSLFIIGIATIAFFSIIIFFLTKPRATFSVNNVAYSEQEVSELPIHIKIPRIGVDATIEHVGLMSDGSVGIPEGPNNTAWFDLSPRPGEPGDSVIDGHAGWKDGIPAVFDDLDKLHIGDKIYVENKKGDTTTFIVRAFKSYTTNENPSSVFVSNDGLAHLNLITCDGTWNANAKTHSERLVVFTDKEV